MHREIVFGKEDFDSLRGHLLQSESMEQAAFLVCGLSRTRTKLRLLVREVVPVPSSGFLAQEQLRLSIAPHFTNRILKRCREERRVVVLCHSHPFSEESARYSWSDDQGERILFDSIHQRVPNLPHASLLFTRTSVAGRFWLGGGTVSPLDSVRVVGGELKTVSLGAGSSGRGTRPSLREHARQVLLFGEEGQQTIQSSRVGIVGAGGTGSVVFEMLLRLGVGQITIVDPAQVESSNLSRIVGSTRHDVGRPKVEVLKAWGSKVNPSVKVRAIPDSITNGTTALELKDADVIFCCTDNHWSRAVLNQFSYQYLIPAVDMGVQLVVENGKVAHASGKVVRLGPGFPCLWCYGDISSDRITEENLPAEERAKLAREGYVRGLDLPNPSVITFNTSVSSAAVTEFLKILNGKLDTEPAARLNFDFLSGSVRRATANRALNCVCSQAAVKALGDLQKLPVPSRVQFGQP